MRNEKTMRLALMFDVLSDPNRLEIVLYLKSGRKSVSEITNYLGMTQSAVSHQLRIMRDTKVLKAERVGKTIYYSINDEHVETIVNTGLVHLSHEVHA